MKLCFSRLKWTLKWTLNLKLVKCKMESLLITVYPHSGFQCKVFWFWQHYNKGLKRHRFITSWIAKVSPLRPFKKARLGLPWWRRGWESACQCRGHEFEPWSGKIPHAAERLGPWATTTEPVHLEPVLRNKRGRDSERPAHRDEEWPPLAAIRESPHTETKTQHSQK